MHLKLKMKSTKEFASSMGLVYNLTDSRYFSFIKAEQVFKFLFVLDFETTCWENKNSPNYPGEIIEFPVVLMNCDNGEIVDKFHSYVMPMEKSRLSEFCINLTGITQKTVDDSGIPLETVMRMFTKWVDEQCDKHKLSVNPLVNDPSRVPATFVTCSDWDLGVQLLHECRRKGISRPPYLNAWIDLRAAYKRYYMVMPDGLNGALNARGLMFAGRQHSGIDDAINTSSIHDDLRWFVTKSY